MNLFPRIAVALEALLSRSVLVIRAARLNKERAVRLGASLSGALLVIAVVLLTIDGTTGDYGSLSSSLVVIAVGVAFIFLVASISSRIARGAIHQRGIWQVATIAMLGLFVAELTGAASAIVGALRPVTSESLVLPDAATSAKSPEYVFGNAKDSVRRPSEAVAPLTVLAIDGLGGPSYTSSDARSEYNNAPPTEKLPLSEEILPALLSTDDRPNGDLSIAVSEEDSVAIANAKPTSRYSHAWTTWFAVVWFTGAVLLSLRLVVDRWRLAQFSRGLRTIGDGPLHAEVTKLCREFSIWRRLRLAEHDAVAGPVAFGTFRPTVVVPCGFLADYSIRQCRAMLAHEVAHLASHDPWWGTWSRVTCCLLWFHPLAWYTQRRLDTASEWAADSGSQVVPDGPSLLAECLVQLGRNLDRRRSPGWTAMAGNGFHSGLGNRVDRLLSLPRQEYRRPSIWSVTLYKSLGFTLVLCAAIVSTSWARAKNPQFGDQKMSLMQSSWRQSLVGLAMLTITSTALANQEEGDPPKDAPSVAAEDRQNGERTKSRPADRVDAPRKQEIRRERERIEIRERRNESSRRTYDGRADRKLRDPRERRQEDRPDQEGRRQPRRDISPLDEDRSHERHEDEREETERRLTQILEASEKLQQAGFDEDARNLRRLADELREHFLGRDGGRWKRETKNKEQQRVRDRSQENREQLRARSRDLHVDSARSDGRSDPVINLLRDMRNELAGLRREMNDLRTRVDANPGARREPRRQNLRERDPHGDAGDELPSSRD